MEWDCNKVWGMVQIGDAGGGSVYGRRGSGGAVVVGFSWVGLLLLGLEWVFEGLRGGGLEGLVGQSGVR